MHNREENEIFESLCQKLGRAYNLSDQEFSVYKVLGTGVLRLTISRRHSRWGGDLCFRSTWDDQLVQGCSAASSVPLPTRPSRSLT
jgi:hypothetical protein